ncbi:MAG: histidine--tRNA ligase [Chloroflexi bacterium]|nr:histidine--tRNA ligase [Chloroflexota bacterium]
MYQRPSGTNDILPADQPYWRYITSRLHHLAALYGYDEIETPLFEDTEVFTRGVGETTDIVEKEMYTIRERPDESLTLRPEFTAGVMRAYLENGMHVLPSPVRLYSIGAIFRRERPQAGRYRQFHQFNAEALGEQDPAVDLEIMSIAYDLYAGLGFTGLSFQLNSTGCPICRPTYLEILKPYFRQHLDQLGDDDRRRLERNPLRILDSKHPAAQTIIEAAPRIVDYLCAECKDHFARLRRYLEVLGRPYTLNHRLVRGLDYYTKTVFEVWAQGIGAQNAMCGGGRYDGLIEVLGGKPTPGVGFAAGLERTILLMKEQHLPVPALPGPQVFLAYLGESAKQRGIELLGDLRRAGIRVTATFGDRSMKAQMRSADKSAAGYAIILGDVELERGVAVVRNLRDKGQQEIPFAELIAHLQGLLAAA